MSSGWPPEEDDRRWEPARHPSAVGAVHDSRDAERGYSGFAHYDAEGQYADGQYAEGTEGGWYGPAGTSYPAVDYQPQPDNAGYGEVSYPDVYDLNGTGAGHDYGTPPAYGPPAGYVEHPSFPNLPAQPHYSAPVSADYEANGYQAGYEQAGYPQADHAQAGEPDYGYADYGDSRYNDPNYGDPAYEDTQAQYAAAEQAPQDPAASYPPDYYQYPPTYEDTDHGYGYVAAEYASGQFPAGVGALGELSSGMPDPAATGMLDASGMLDATGIADYAELYNYHPGDGAEASHAFADAAAPMGLLDSSGLAVPPDATTIDGLAPILGAQAADATGVLDGGTASTYFAGAPAFHAAPTFTPAPEYADEAAAFAEQTAAYPGQTAAYEGGTFADLAPAPAPAGAMPAFTATAVTPESASLDLSPADSFGSAGTGASKTSGTGALLRPRSTRPAGKRRGGSGDRRLWFALGGVLAVAAAAIIVIVMVAFPSGPSGPAHTLVAPNQLNAFVRRPALEQQMNVGQLRQDVVNMSSGQARHLVEGVYESGNSTSGATPQIILLIGGNLVNASPADSVTSFTKRFKGATLTSAGALGGKAVCVNATASEPGSVAMCAWFDNDTFGEVVSPTMKASTLAGAMRQLRPKVEHLAPKQP